MKHAHATNRPEPKFGFGESIMILIAILIILGSLIIVKQQEPQAPLFIAFTLLAVYARLRGFKWSTIMDGMRTGLKDGVDPLVIFLSIGVLIATWIFSGTIPTIMYFGFKIISVQFFCRRSLSSVPLWGSLAGAHLPPFRPWGLPLLGLGLP